MEMRRNERQKNKRESPLSKAILSLILTAAIGVFLIAGLKLLSIHLNYQAAEDTYEKIRQEAEQEDSQLPEGQDENYPHVDFNYLLSLNPDTVGYLYCEDLMEYPVVQGSDNEYYLHTMFDGSPNAAGTLFVDHRITDGIEAKNCIIYGHNMNDGSMFGALGKFADPEFYKTHRIFHVYTPEHHYVYKAVAAYTADVDGFTYAYSFTADGDFQQFLNQTMQASWFENDTELTTDSNLITLSTCLDNGSDEYRNVVVLTREEEITKKPAACWRLILQQDILFRVLHMAIQPVSSHWLWK